MDAPYQAGSDVHVLPAHLPLPGAGFLPINAFVLMAEEPVLVDTGLGMDSDDFIDALASIVKATDLRWLWLTHDDTDHTGSIQRVLQACPHAKLVTHAMGALRMSTWWQVPLDRVHAIRPGDRLPAGDRTLRAVPPPLFDNPTSTGFIDEATGAFFSVDSFGAFIPEPAHSAADVPREALAGGMAAWACGDSPWVHLTDRQLFAGVIDRVRQLEPTAIFSSHLPAAPGTSLDGFLDLLSSLPDAEPAVAPSNEEFGQLLAAMMATMPPAEADVIVVP
ncbi:MAG: MBL fold metallo-hydrolase [Acidimicrobiales bacterium]